MRGSCSGVLWMQKLRPHPGGSPGLSKVPFKKNFFIKPCVIYFAYCQGLWFANFCLSGSFYFIFSKTPLNKDCKMSGIVKKLCLVVRWIMFHPDNKRNGWLGVQKQLPTYLIKSQDCVLRAWSELNSPLTWVVWGQKYIVSSEPQLHVTFHGIIENVHIPFWCLDSPVASSSGTCQMVNNHPWIQARNWESTWGHSKKAFPLLKISIC